MNTWDHLVMLKKKNTWYLLGEGDVLEHTHCLAESRNGRWNRKANGVCGRRGKGQMRGIHTHSPLPHPLLPFFSEKQEAPCRYQPTLVHQVTAGPGTSYHTEGRQDSPVRGIGSTGKQTESRQPPLYCWRLIIYALQGVLMGV